MSDLERAIEIAARAHRPNPGDEEKKGDAYIIHPLTVMLRFRDRDARIVAVLHDVVEDSEVTLAHLEDEGFTPEILAAVDALTKREDEPYEDYIKRLRPNPLARRVKIADLEHNMDLTRLEELGSWELKRTAKYHRYWLELRDPDPTP
jgi:(p)ppGpp synthase/HD superfamily hydrolase